MKYAVVSSSTLSNPHLNPGMRIAASFGMSLTAIEQGRIDLLRQCFDYMFNRPGSANTWFSNFRKCNTWEAAERHLLRQYGLENVDKTKIPVKFLEGSRVLTRRLLEENLEQLLKEQETLKTQAQLLASMLKESDDNGKI